MLIPRLAREAGLARGCGEEEERIQYYPVNIRYCQVPGEPLAPCRGISGPLAGISPGGDVAAGPRLSGPSTGGGENPLPPPFGEVGG